MKVEFVKSSTTINQCPSDRWPEFAFIGRSNVGKSSLINMITDRKQLAHVSNRPGKTQHINHYLIDDTWYIVDLPGYGWAKVSKTEKEKWQTMIVEYFTERKNLFNVFLLVDVRHAPLENDLKFMEFLGVNQIPFSIIFTKADKVSPNIADSNIAKYKKVMLKEWEEFPNYLLTSSETKKGRDEIIKTMKEIMSDAKKSGYWQ